MSTIAQARRATNVVKSFEDISMKSHIIIRVIMIMIMIMMKQ